MKLDRTVRLIEQKNKTEWDTLIQHPLQSWEWGEFRKKMGVDVVRLGVFEGQKLTSGWQITFHKIPGTSWTIGYFPKGPMPDDTMVETLKSIGKQKKAVYIQLEPNVTVRDTKYKIQDTLIPSHHPLFTKYTFILDLTKSEDELRASLHSKTRYNLKVAQKHNVRIQEDNSDEAFAQYIRLSGETTQRQGFYAHNTKYHQTMWSILMKAGIAHLFTAVFEGKTLAAWILFTWNKTVYYPYGSSSRDHREVMAPQLLLWEIALWGKRNGYAEFDLWGAMGPQPDEKDPWYGFHRFKEGFTPLLVEFVGSFDLVINPFLYHLYTALDSIRWIILKIKH